MIRYYCIILAMNVSQTYLKLTVEPSTVQQKKSSKETETARNIIFIWRFLKQEPTVNSKVALPHGKQAHLSGFKAFL